MSGISIGLAIKEMLKNVAGGRVFPVEAALGTDMPLIVYQRDSVTQDGDKDGSADIVSVTVVIVAPTYEKSIEIAEQVRKALCRCGTFAGIEIADFELADADEGKEDAAWLQGMSIKYEIG
jgi:hypothetical protein